MYDGLERFAQMLMSIPTMDCQCNLFIWKGDSDEVRFKKMWVLELKKRNCEKDKVRETESQGRLCRVGFPLY